MKAPGSISGLLKDPVFRFLFLGVALYLAWLAAYEWWIHPDGRLDRAIIGNTIFLSEQLLQALGWDLIETGGRIIRIQGSPGVFIGDSCNGLSLFVLFSIFLAVFPGKAWAKWLFIPAGIAFIHLLNVLRVSALAIMVKYSYAMTEFNHTYTFTVIIYGFIILFWYWWIGKYSRIVK